jgi:hypothetical protein
MSKKGCPVDIVDHPVDGWRVKAEGEKATCDAKLDELLRNLGPYGKKYLKRRWEFKKAE